MNVKDLLKASIYFLIFTIIYVALDYYVGKVTGSSNYYYQYTVEEGDSR